MADVFISYKSERRPAARHLAKILRLHGFEVWYDYGLIPGDAFEPRLLAELEAAKVIVVLWCGLSVRSDWVFKEASIAQSAGKLLPCWIEKAPPPDAFKGAHTLDLTGWDGAPRSHALDGLLADIGRRLGRNPAPAFEGLRELDEDWRGLGAPSLAAFGLGAPTPAQAEDGAPTVELGPRPAALDGDAAALWDRAARGDAPSISELGSRLLRGADGFEADARAGVRITRIAADLGDARAQFNMGTNLLQGAGGLEPDEREAVRLFKLASAQGFAAAQASLGVMYEHGRGGLAADDVEAVRLYRQAAGRGDPGGQTNLGVMWKLGKGGLPADDREAVRLFTLAAGRDHADAQAHLGFMMLTGRGGLVADDREAVRLLRLGAAGGSSIGQLCLANLYENGLHGLPRDLEEAARLYRMAAEQGQAFARDALKRLGAAP